MKAQLLIVLIGLTTVGTQAAPLVTKRCGPAAASDAVLYSSDLAWNQPFDAMMERYSRIYHSGKRLAERAVWHPHTSKYELVRYGLPVPITAEFVQAVTTHIEKALLRKYADAVFFSDLGHSHVLIPDDRFPIYAGFPVERFNELYTVLLADPSIRFLYHTAEQLDTAGLDPHLVWRQNTRNLIGENRPGGEVYVEPGYHEKAHTLSAVKGYHWWSAGFNVSASRDGCFPFQLPSGEVRYFDISLKDLESDPAHGSFAKIAALTNR